MINNFLLPHSLLKKYIYYNKLNLEWFYIWKGKVGNEIKFLEFLFNHEKGNERKKDENIFVYFKFSLYQPSKLVRQAMSSIKRFYNREIIPIIFIKISRFGESPNNLFDKSDI